jgi:flagellar hook-associated protein 2
VAAAIYAARAPERAWQAQQATLASQTTAITALQTATQSLVTDMEQFNSLTGPLAKRTVTSSNTNVTATAAAGTVAGTHTVNVSSPAQTGSWYSDLATSPTAALPATSFTLTSGSGSATFSTGNGINSLNDLATAINANTSLGVRASVVSDSSGARLAILSSTSGAAADFSISSTNYTGTSWNSPSIPTGGSLGANSITLVGDGNTATFTTQSGDTYDSLAAKINNADPPLGITATSVSDAHGTHLSLVSTDGVSSFSVNQPSFGFSQASKGADASLTVDGVPITSASNLVTGAIPGVTLNVLGATGTSSTLTIASDAAAASTAINQFVSDYNTAISSVNSQFQFNAATGSQGVLSTDPVVRNLQAALMQTLNYTGTPASGSNVGSTLASLGISMGHDGQLTVDTSALNNALISNAADVQNFFMGASLNGFAHQMDTTLKQFSDPSVGAFSVDLKSISNTNDGLSQQISDLEANYIANQQTILTAMYSKAEIALQQLPTQMAQLQAELGNNTKNGG